MFQVLTEYKAGFLKIKINKQDMDLEISRHIITFFMHLLSKKESKCVGLI